MSTKTHGPLPWHADEIGRNDVNAPVMVVRDARGHAVAEYLAEDDANYIVRSANAHDDLVSVLRDIEMETRDGGQWTPEEINEVARAALAKAGAA